MKLLSRTRPMSGLARSMAVALVLLIVLTGITEFAVSRGLIIGNATPSVPRGLYLRANPDQATYVTFCLGIRHRGVWTYPELCTPDTPDATRILKRISLRNPDGSLTVGGDTPNALDSRFLGPIRPEEIRGWWVPLLTEKRNARHMEEQ